MKTKTGISNNIAVFSKWSRKSYAIFASLKKVVKIARLSVDICVSSFKKQQLGIHLLFQKILEEGKLESLFDYEEQFPESLALQLIQFDICESEIQYDINKLKYFLTKSPCCALLQHGLF